MSKLEFARWDEKSKASGSGDLTAGHLMLQIQHGDAEAFELLVGRYWQNLAGYASQLLGCMDEGKDVAQEVFVRAWEYRRRWKPGGSAETFLYRIARNLSLLRLRRREVRTRYKPEIRRRCEAVPTPFDATIVEELDGALQQALRELPTRRRQAFLLVRLEGHSLGAAAETMGVTKRTVANHVYMATCHLEHSLQPYLC